ncbi:multi-sensor signal transduction multi-kinase [Tolypothrix sp. NIES-4075]|uniref:trifunctional serine/threonine-protein kinase/ATP-binding protein/sensor histidine kinase n=1 Tax=Tolypothrix sp. NIES-4075 TaxID=2005459 RepID=UPI000B5C2B62|nr:ATP-binding sensor histidine kinase [Tolypothrix sp. NIES-4075]GAX40391.1 multi-sensor signal transduction multi-kinase [Tolypothrix sp. NIES-4075]
MTNIDISLPGYRIQGEFIYSGNRTLVYRGLRECDRQLVIIKLLNSEYPSFSELVQFRNQYTIAKNLNIPGIVKAYNLETYRNSYALVMEDFGGISLKEWKIGKSNSLSEFLHIAIQIVSALEGLHRDRIIHKDIKPANILINTDSGEVKLIDFSIASLLPREFPEIQNPNILEGTLAYLSPEQTGRMNRGIDYRSDFYSLGVTFFELLTGQLPFTSNDPMELVHFHIAKLAPLVEDLNASIPHILSLIVNKLMGKNAEDRYQSAFGLKYDLQVCLKQWQETGNIANFELGMRDVCDRFVIPEKLYGRDKEVATLLTAFDRVCKGEITLTVENAVTPKSKIELMLIAGSSGIGKTVVVNEVHKPIVKQRGYFIKGKFDQFQRNIPFFGFVQAFQDLIEQLVGENNTQIAAWKTKILTALGENSQVIIDVIPELERIIGKQFTVPELSGSAAQNRFNLLLQKFIQVFTTPEHPLVIFLDDLQWADLASFKLIELLMSQAEKGYLLLIGAYRDNEVTATHPLMLTLDEISKTQARINTITLTPLEPNDLNHLIADTFKCSSKLTQPLTELVYQKTKGNPFFNNQFLKLLHEDRIINFNFDEGYWQCDIAQVKTLAFNDDVVEFMALQLQKLPNSTQEVLKLAACIGNQFDLATLASVSEKSQVETAADLWKALQEGLVFPTSKVYKFFQDDNQDTKLPITNDQLANYKFLHDRVQQAAYLLIPSDCKQETHLKIGQFLLKNTVEAEREERIFEIVNQLNYAVEKITVQSEKNDLAKLNLIAGLKAKASTANAAAVEYLTLGIKLLSVNSWETNYDLSLALHESAAETAFLSMNFQQTEQFIQVVLAQSNTLLDKMKAYQIRLEAYKAQSMNLEAITTGLQVLNLCGIELPEQPSQADIEQVLKETQLILAEKQIQELIDLPPMIEPTKLAVMNFLGRFLSITYICNPPMFPLVVAQQINLSLKYGNCGVSAMSYLTYGMILSNICGDIDGSYQFGQLALNLLIKFNAKEIKCIVFFANNAFIKPWKEHLRETLNSFLEAYSIGLETGDSENAAFSIYVYSDHSFWLGKNLADIENNIGKYHDAIAKIKQERPLQLNAIYWQAVLNLLGCSEKLCCLKGEVYNEEIMLPLHQQVINKEAIACLYLQKLFLSYLFQDYPQALQNATFIKNYLDAVQARVLTAIFYFYSSLTLLAIYPESLQAEQNQILNKISNNQDKLKKWADHAPMNYLHKYYLVEAERHRVLGEYVQAMEMYDRAISLARMNEYVNEEALANELTAKFYLEWGKEKIAQVYLIDAYYAYARWGAKAKINDLEKRYPQFLSPILNREKISLKDDATICKLTTRTVTASSTSGSSLLDMATVMKAYQALSSEIELDKLIFTLMQVVIENSGAERGALLRLQSDNLVVEATGNIDREKNFITDNHQIPHTVINYVQRTQQTIVINDIAAETKFANDPYIIEHQPKSVLCTPILNQGKLISILYLENNLTKKAFTSDRIQIINLLCSQAAICLENARLYQQSQESLENLKQMQLQLVQSEKMSALGNLVAGVAHEINNPIGFISGNLQPAVDYVQDLFNLIDLYQEHYPTPVAAIESEIEIIDLEYLRSDLPKLLTTMKEGVKRIRHISASLRTFSRADSDRPVSCNIHDGIDSTILILKHRIKANETRPAIEVVTNYGNLPSIECYPGQLNQVFMNLLANAIDALEEFNIGRSFSEIQANPNQITIKTSFNQDKNHVLICIKDNGLGMSDEVKQKVFDHLFTTKPVGQGTGLGLAIAKSIVVEKHGGTLEVKSSPKEGAEFAITIPVRDKN